MDTLYQGRRGSGKTLGAVLDLLLDKMCHKEIWTNTPLHPWFNARYFDDPYNLIDEIFDNDSNVPKTILFDEIDKWSASRDSQKEVNKLLNNMISQARKRNIKAIYTTQYLGGYDIQLRGLTDYFIRCIPIIDYRDIGLGTYDYPEPIFFTYEVYDLNLYKKINRYKFSRNTGRMIYPLYDSIKMITPVGMIEDDYR